MPPSPGPRRAGRAAVRLAGRGRGRSAPLGSARLPAGAAARNRIAPAGGAERGGAPQKAEGGVEERRSGRAQSATPGGEENTARTMGGAGKTRRLDLCAGAARFLHLGKGELQIFGGVLHAV